MNKRTIITILLALVTVAGQGQLMEQREQSGVYSNYAESLPMIFTKLIKLY